MSVVSLHCQNRVQRLRGGCADTTPPPGSRSSAPWILWSKRGLPQYTHANPPPLHLARAQTPGGTDGARPGFSALACRSAWTWRVRGLRAKIAAFPGAMTARPSPPGDGRRRGRALRPPPPFPLHACRCRARTETVPPPFLSRFFPRFLPPFLPRAPMPP